MNTFKEHVSVGEHSRIYPAVQHQDVLWMCVQPVLYRCANTDDLIQAGSQDIHPTRVQNLMEKGPHALQYVLMVLQSDSQTCESVRYLVVDSAQSVMLLREVDELEKVVCMR